MNLWRVLRAAFGRVPVDGTTTPQERARLDAERRFWEARARSLEREAALRRDGQRGKG